MFRNLNYSEKNSIKNVFYSLIKLKIAIKKYQFINFENSSISKSIDLTKLLDLINSEEEIIKYIDTELLINKFLNLQESLANKLSKYILNYTNYDYLYFDCIIDDIARNFNIDIEHNYFSDLALEYTLYKSSKENNLDECFDIYNEIYQFKNTFKELNSNLDDDSNDTLDNNSDDDLLSTVSDTFGNYFADEAFCICIKGKVFNTFFMSLLNKYLFDKDKFTFQESDILLYPNVFTDGTNTHILLPSILEIDKKNQYLIFIFFIALFSLNTNLFNKKLQ